MKIVQNFQRKASSNVSGKVYIILIDRIIRILTETMLKPTDSTLELAYTCMNIAFLYKSGRTHFSLKYHSKVEISGNQLEKWLTANRVSYVIINSVISPLTLLLAFLVCAGIILKNKGDAGQRIGPDHPVEDGPDHLRTNGT